MKLLVDKRGRKYLVNGKEIHTNLGIVDIGGAKNGSRVKSHIGHEFTVLCPGLIDIYEKMPRAGSFMLKKDIGLILGYTGLGSGDVVVDVGTGSGALAIFLGNIVKPGGKVYTYEIKQEFAAIARENIEKAGLSEYVKVKVKDIREGIKEKADLVTVDMGGSWSAVPNAVKALKTGGFIAIYTPYIEHAKRVFKELKSHNLKDIRTLECLERELEFRAQGTRPKTKMVGHTGYLTFARKY